uniref:M20 family metallopeptidase n=1 Tax=Roseihalotalea indica TaxID=2867963 RepID=A0AA49JJD0_9BACT|nr:M20 family metallopeptidase [Tunicatimonas sp. TK19036]
MRKYLTLFCSLALITSGFAQSKLSKDEKALLTSLDDQYEKYSDIAHQIWNYAELGYQEEQSSQLLQKTLTDAGFSVEKGVAGIPTAFMASYGSGEPVVGLLAEFDALPGMSQTATPERDVKEEGKGGHACGHHLFGTGSVAAAIAVKDWLEESGTSGTIRLYGTPAEEGGAGKVYMVREGLLDDVNTVLHWHPGSQNSASARSSLANKSAKFRFTGQPAHAAAAPEKGRSALDGVEAMNMMVNMMREHVPAETRIHYVITKGGDAPNIVPGSAEVFYYVRHPEMQDVRDIFERVVKAAEGAALGTETQMEYEVIHGIYNVLPNETLSEKMYENLKTVGGVSYDEEEKAFAEQIRTTYDPEDATLASAGEIQPYTVSNRGTGGSTDVGDVSWMAPTAGMSAATWVPGTFAHSWQAVAAGGTSIGHKGMMVAAKTLSLTALDVFKNPEIADEAREELMQKRGDDFAYESLLGDREPPLDYRK